MPGEGKYPLPFPDFLQNVTDRDRPGKVAHSLQHPARLYRIRDKRFFGAVNRHLSPCQLALRQIFRDTANNNRRDHRLIALNVHNNGIVAESALLPPLPANRSVPDW